MIDMEEIVDDVLPGGPDPIPAPHHLIPVPVPDPEIEGDVGNKRRKRVVGREMIHIQGSATKVLPACLLVMKVSG